MTRPTRAYIDPKALLHNVRQVRRTAPGKNIIAMVKANAYGCGLSSVLPVLEGHVDAFGVASLEEAMRLRNLGSHSQCILFQGVFGQDELQLVATHHLQCVIHHAQQLQWLLDKPLPHKIKIWVKVNTGMHRLGFEPSEVDGVIRALMNCAWVDDEIGLMTHLACADEPANARNFQQLKQFNSLVVPPQASIVRSVANSAAILALNDAHADVVRPGIMLYGVSPFAEKEGRALGLMPVMRFVSAVSAIHHFPSKSTVGYGATWQSDKPSIIGVVPAGYGDGYPRHISQATPSWVAGYYAPIIGRISMDMLTIDLTACAGVKIGDPVELWGQYISVETIAKSAGTIGYELICQLSPRVRQN